MDFHSLTRRELQALCKKNKIPANITNVAMAEALQALKIVEYTEEFTDSHTGSTLSSVESLEIPEVTSPFPTPTATRSTRRTNVPKQALESANPTTRTRGTTRRTQFKDSDVIGTPALVAQTNRKKCQMASACRTMDSQFRECVDEGKNDNLLTPAATSRRKIVEESTVKRIYSTRRSARLAEKNKVALNEVVNEESQISKKELIAEDMKVKYGVEDFPELSGITGIEEKSEDKYEHEVVSDQTQEASVDKDVSEDVSSNEQDMTTVEEIELRTQVEEEKYTNSENEGDYGENTVMPLNASSEVQQSDVSEDVCISEMENTVQINTKELKSEEASEAVKNNDEDTVMLLNASNEVQQSDVCHDVCISETENTVQNNSKELKVEEASEAVEIVNVDSGVSQVVCISGIEAIIQNTEELKIEKSEAFKDKAAEDLIDNVILENGDNTVVDDSPSENAGFQDEHDDLDNYTTNESSENVQDSNVTSEKLTDITLQQTTKEVDSDFTNHLDTHVQLKENEQNKLVQLEENKMAAYPDADYDLGFPIQISEKEPNEMEVVQIEEITKHNDPVISDADQIVESVCEETNEANKSEITSLEEKEKPADPSDESTVVVYAETNHPANACVRMKTKSSSFSIDNKENFGSEGGIMKDARVATKYAEDGGAAVELQELSLIKLRKMLKKLKISENSSKNQNGSEAPTRLALRAISDNKLVDDETHLPL